MKIAFFIAALFCLSPWASPPIALTLGIVLGLSLGNPYPKKTGPFSKTLLQIAVVCLGFGMDLGVVLRAGRDGLLFAAVSILVTLGLGWWLGKVLSIHPRTSALVSSGTAICGGSAIAAVGGVIAATEIEMSVAMGTVFMLNATALFIFPPLGHWLDLTQLQFGTWAGVAIHDVSSVVGAAASYGPDALNTATAVKLSRTLWIIPVALAFGALLGQGEPDGEEGEKAPKAKLRVPWFIFGFLFASLLRSTVPMVAAIAPYIAHLAHPGLQLVLFLIGAGINRTTLSKVQPAALVQGVILWVVISVGSLAAVTLLGA
ncbi:MAG: YeiH family protein [Vulcanimicrobiota bacterium]